MYNMASKLKPLDLEIKPGHIIHLVFASLPKEFDPFIINYNMQPEQWDMKKMIAMCVQEEDRIRSSHDGLVNYVEDNKKKNFHPSSSSKAHSKAPMSPQHQQNNFIVDKDQFLHCKKKGHYKKNCTVHLKKIMAKDLIRRGLRKEEKDALKSQMESKQKLKLLATSP